MDVKNKNCRLISHRNEFNIIYYSESNSMEGVGFKLAQLYESQIPTMLIFLLFKIKAADRSINHQIQ